MASAIFGRKLRHAGVTVSWEMMASPEKDLALELFHRAYRLQMQGELELAIEFYKRSIAAFPTAEAHTFLGWTYRFQGRLQDAIEECRRAIAVDPGFGNPYNDIGAYLIEKEQLDEAVEWLEKATRSARYDSYHYPWFNLGRVWMKKGLLNRARECFQKALELAPSYEPAREALGRLRLLVQ